MNQFKKDVKFVVENTKHDAFYLLILNLFKIVIVFCDFAYNTIQSLIIDAGLNFQPNKEINTTWYLEFFLNGNFGERGSLKLVISLAICFFLILAIINVSKYFQGTLSVLFRSKNRLRLRAKAYRKFCDHNQNYNSGELFNLLKDDVVGVGDFYYVYIPSIVMDAVYIIMAITTLFDINFYLLIVPLISAPILLTYCIVYIKKLYNAQLTIREQSAQLRSVTQENLEGIKALKLFNTLNFSKQRFKQKNVDYTTSLVEKNLLSNRYDLIFNIIKKTTYIISLIIGGILAINGEISIGQFLIFTTFVVTLLNYITTIVSDIANAKLCILHNRKLQTFFEHENDIKEIENPEVLPTGTIYNLDVKKLKLLIDEKTVLNNVSFNIPKGTTVGIIGGSSSGKTALIKALMRILPYESGTVNIEHTDLLNLQIKNLRDLFSYHMQNPVLFNISIKDNLTYSGCPVSDERIAEVLKQTYADDVLLQVNNGLDHVLEDGGNSFGVYKLRLSICRAILKDSPFYVFDDFTHGYNDAEKKELCKNIINLLPNKTLLMLSNSYDDVKSCKLILKLNQGKVEFFGTSADYVKFEKGGAQNDNKN